MLSMSSRARQEGTNVSEIELIEAVKIGDNHAFDRLYHLYKNLVFLICLRILRDEHLAEDAMQDTFLSAWKSIQSFRYGSTLKNWIAKIAFNTAINMKRRHYRAKEIPGLDDPQVDQLVAQVDMEEMIYVYRLQRQLLDALESVPIPYRDALKLSVQGNENKEIAKILCVPIGTVMSRVFRGRQKLKATIEAR
jgi:RNA polymerase sigma factor (sigma-70 family)